jgi:hypothetical protein
MVADAMLPEFLSNDSIRTTISAGRTFSTSVNDRTYYQHLILFNNIFRINANRQSAPHRHLLSYHQ